MGPNCDKGGGLAGQAAARAAAGLAAHVDWPALAWGARNPVSYPPPSEAAGRVTHPHLLPPVPLALAVCCRGGRPGWLRPGLLSGEGAYPQAGVGLGGPRGRGLWPQEGSQLAFKAGRDGRAASLQRWARKRVAGVCSGRCGAERKRGEVHLELVGSPPYPGEA